MKKLTPFLLILLIALDYVYAQESIAKIENVRFSAVRGLFHSLDIRYDIVDYGPDEEFSVGINVLTADGRRIDIKRNPIGDIGEEIRGGNNKQIFVDLQEGVLGTSTQIQVEVFASPSPIDEDRLYVFLQRVRQSKFQYYLRAAVWPGWGQAAYDVRKRPQYGLVGLATYGMLGVSYYLNQESSDRYDAYLEAIELEERNSLFSEAEDLDQQSKILAYSAAGLWAANMIWMALKKRGQEEQASLKGWYVQPTGNGMALGYRF